MNTKKPLRIMISLVFIILFMYASQGLPVLFGGNAFFSPAIGLIYCKDEWTCRHEVGHLMDYELGGQSRTEEFGYNMAVYLYCQYKYLGENQFTNQIAATLFVYSNVYKPFHVEAASSPQEELYANIYAEADGDMNKIPIPLQAFYKEDDRYEKIYQEALKHGYYITKGEIMKDKLKELVENMKKQATEHRELLITVGSALVGAAIGATITATILKSNLFSYDANSLLLDEEPVVDEVE